MAQQNANTLIQKILHFCVLRSAKMTVIRLMPDLKCLFNILHLPQPPGANPITVFTQYTSENKVPKFGCVETYHVGVQATSTVDVHSIFDVNIYSPVIIDVNNAVKFSSQKKFPNLIKYAIVM